MTDRASIKKRVERFHAREAASKLGETWTLEDRESPDFLVESEGRTFALEVTECHIGPKGRRGSKARSAERQNQKWLEGIRAEFGEQRDVQLHLRYHGAATSKERANLLHALVAAGFQHRAEFEVIKGRFDDGWFHAFKSPQPSWIFLNDRVGWVSTDGSYLQREIDAKARNLPRYRSICEDVRLLVVADRIYNSGKLELDDRFRPDFRGFDAVYFFAYPLSVKAFYPD